MMYAGAAGGACGRRRKPTCRSSPPGLFVFVLCLCLCLCCYAGHSGSPDVCVCNTLVCVCVRARSGAPAPSVGGGKNLTARESAHGLDTYTYSRLTIRHARTQRDLEQQIATIKNSQQAAAATTNAAIAPMPARASSVPDPCSPLCSLRWHTPDGTIVRSILGPSSSSRLRSPVSNHENHGFRT